MLEELHSYVKESLSDYIVDSDISFGELNLTIHSHSIIEVMLFLRNDSRCQFIGFVDISAVDYPSRKDRLQVSYHLLSPKHNQRIRVKLFVDEHTAVPSICSVYAGAEWYEREAYDMYGVLFKGNPDLRRILTDYGFEGHPLRKDFPLTGFVECRYDSDLKRIVYEEVALKQELRNFDSLSPWRGYENKLQYQNRDVDSEV